jgi:hypothetical protein
MTKVWIYEYGRDEMKVFKSETEPQAWFKIHDPEGVAFAYEQGPALRTNMAFRLRRNDD